MGPVRRPGQSDFPGNSPTVILFFGGVWFAVWSFVRRPFPALETVPLLDLLEYHNPNFYSAVVIWYYLSPLVAVMLAGSISLSIWKVWIEARKRDLGSSGWGGAASQRQAMETAALCKPWKNK